MPCGSCIDKLAYKLIRNHKIDMIRAYELAEKGIERHEKAKAKTVTQKEMETLGFDPDYSVACTATAQLMLCPNGGNDCGSSAQCPQGTCPPHWPCPAPPKPNSHWVSDTCAGVITVTCVRCVITCREVGTCVYSGSCYYDCDAGYIWNPATLQCELPVVGEARWDGYYFLDPG